MGERRRGSACVRRQQAELAADASPRPRGIRATHPDPVDLSGQVGGAREIGQLGIRGDQRDAAHPRPALAQSLQSAEQGRAVRRGADDEGRGFGQLLEQLRAERAGKERRIRRPGIRAFHHGHTPHPKRRMHLVRDRAAKSEGRSMSRERERLVSGQLHDAGRRGNAIGD